MLPPCPRAARGCDFMVTQRNITVWYNMRSAHRNGNENQLLKFVRLAARPLWLLCQDFETCQLIRTRWLLEHDVDCLPSWLLLVDTLALCKSILRPSIQPSGPHSRCSVLYGTTVQNLYSNFRLLPGGTVRVTVPFSIERTVQALYPGQPQNSGLCN
jgi:hypothetical protein